MYELKASCTIAAPEPETETRQEPCWVQQLTDTEDTVPCSGAGDILNSLLSRMGIEVPAPKESETYSTSISVKPKNSYTNLNLSLTHGNLSDPVYKQGVATKKITVNIGDFIEDSGKYYIDLATKMDITDSDNIISAAWSGVPVDDDLAEIPATQRALSVTSENKIKANVPANGVIRVRYDELTINYKIDIPPRDGVESGFYDTHLVINAEGCEDAPFFYNVEVPDCYERIQRLGQDDGSGDTELGPPAPPRGGEEYACDYCLCTLDLKYETYAGLCPGSGQEPSDRCKSGPNHKDC